MMRATLFAVAFFAFLQPATSFATTFTDDFEGGTNFGGWRFIEGADVIEPAGGNPGGWLHQPVYDTFDPAVVSAWNLATPFVGDYRTRNVSNLSFDLQNLHMDFGDGTGFPVVLLLRNTHGTPDDFDDDDYAYFVDSNVPLVGAGWAHYSFDVPSQSADAVPSGWLGGWAGDCATFRPGVEWSDIVSNVDRVEIHWLDPCFFAIFQQWNVGVDNVTIVDGEDPTSVEESSWGEVKSLYRR